jgi:DAK2 domain fusion protein YloV
MDAVRRTPEQLDVLREAGVVDAGGFGFAAMLAGSLSYLKGESDGALTVEVPAISTEGALRTGGSPAAGVRSEFIARAEAEVWGYCVSFAIEGKGLDPDGIRDRATAIGKSCVVAGDDRQVKVHLHTMNPGEPLGYAVPLGTLSNISILNMDEQSRQWAESQQSQTSQKAAASSGSTQDAARPDSPVASLGVVAVVAGDGLTKLFVANGLGACTVVPGGDSMNPSTGELLAAVENVAAKIVIILPNNKNVVGTARQVAGLTSKAVHVVPTTSVQAGISALLAFSPDQPAGSNVEAMGAAAKSVRAIAICRALRDSRVDGLPVKAGQAMGIVDGKLRKVGDDVVELAIALMVETAGEAELATIYRGAETSRPEAEAVARSVMDRIPGVEVEVVDGDQPSYPYLISVE